MLIRNDDGSIAVLSAMLMVVAVALTAMAMNIQRAYHAQAQMSHAADTAALAAAIEYSITSDEAVSKNLGLKYYTANAPTSNITVSNINIDTATGRVSVDNSKTINSYFKNWDDLNPPVHAVAVADNNLTGSLEYQEVALVLDVTSSMGENNKMVDMKNAATSLVNDLFEANSNIHISVVPFNTTIKFDTSYQYENWLDSEAYARFTTAAGNGHSVAGNEPWNGCVVNNKPPHDVLDTSHTQTKLLPWNENQGYLDSVMGLPTLNVRLNNDRNALFHYAQERSDGGGGGGGYNVHLNQGCSPPTIIPLTNQVDPVLALINSLDNSGYGDGIYAGTIGSIGMLWGWRNLSPKWKNQWFNAEADSPADYDAAHKSIVFLTDGVSEMQNYYGGYGYSDTSGVNFPYSWQVYYNFPGSSFAEADLELDERLKTVCTNIQQTDSIDVYTIGFGINGNSSIINRARSVLQHCASEPENFFDAQDGNALSDAFKTIAEAITGGMRKPVKLVE